MEPELSIVIPLHNQEPCLRELLRRAIRAASEVSHDFELVLVDDGSTDSTGRLLEEARAQDPRVLPLHLESNHGQFRATQEGLRVARGAWVVVLDGDLQDPPETVADLVREMRRARGVLRAVYAVKTRRQEGVLFKVLRAVYGACLRLGDVPVPPGAGSYLLVDKEIARRVAQCRLRYCNLAVVAATEAGTDFSTVEYVKQPRPSGSSRAGWSGLLKEAVGSLLLSGSLHRLLSLAALSAFAAGALWSSSSPLAQRVSLAVGFLFLGSSALAWGIKRRCWPTCSGPPQGEG